MNVKLNVLLKKKNFVMSVYKKGELEKNYEKDLKAI